MSAFVEQIRARNIFTQIIPSCKRKKKQNNNTEFLQSGAETCILQQVNSWIQELVPHFLHCKLKCPVKLADVTFKAV